MPVPSPEEMVSRARDLIPALVERAAQDRGNQLPDATIADFEKAKFTRILQPKRYGGYEMDPAVFAQVHMALGEGDLSAAWVYGVCAGHTYHLAYLDGRAQNDVWGENPDARIVSPYAPTGTLTPCAGGYSLSARWKFSSGSPHSDWAMLGALVAGDVPKPRVC